MWITNFKYLDPLKQKVGFLLTSVVALGSYKQFASSSISGKTFLKYLPKNIVLGIQGGFENTIFKYRPSLMYTVNNLEVLGDQILGQQL